MIGADIVQFTAQLLDIWDSRSRDVMRGKKLNGEDLMGMVNHCYQEDAFSAIKALKPDLFKRKFFLSNWEWTGTAASGSTASTLIASEPTFDPTMIGGTVYNSTAEESATITGYTSTTTVTLDETIGDTWDGDTIYLFTGRLPFKDTLANMVECKYLSVKYDEDATIYTPVTENTFEGVHNEAFEDTTKYSQSHPVRWDDHIRVLDTDSFNGVVFRPLPETPITNGVYIEGQCYPEAITEGTSPFFPKGHHLFLAYGAALMAADTMSVSDSDKKDWATKYERGLAKLRSEYRPRGVVQREFYRRKFDR